MAVPTTHLPDISDPQYSLAPTPCQYCGEFLPIGQTKAITWFNFIWHLHIDCPKQQELTSNSHGTRKDYELAGRDPAHTFKDIRSARRARKRDRNERKKYDNYQYVKRGQLGVEYCELDCNQCIGRFGDIRSQERPTTMTKTNLYREARLNSTRPRHHRFCKLCHIVQERAKRNTDVQVIKRSELDALHYDDGYDSACDPVDEIWCYRECCIGGFDVLYDENGKVGTLAELDERRHTEFINVRKDQEGDYDGYVTVEHEPSDEEVSALDSDDDFVLLQGIDEDDMERVDLHDFSDTEEVAYVESRETHA